MSEGTENTHKPWRIMGESELLEKLKKGNPKDPEVLEELAAFFEFHGLPTVLRKGRDLPEVVEALIKNGKCPLIDKKLGLVFGINSGSHEALRHYLYWYHNGGGDGRASLSAAWYIVDGNGYYISSMRPDTIVVGTQYRPDAYDKDLFMLYKVDQTL